MKPLMQISFSGGRTSAYMTKKIIDNLSDQYEFIITFANTGMEHPRTLDFIKKCDDIFKFNTVWLEGFVHYDEKKSSTHKIVDYNTASRNGEPYEAFIKKYGIPNTAFPQCTRELKLNPMQSYLKSLNINYKKIPTAIGIRADEKRRISKNAENMNIIYPLIDTWPTDKQDILDWWEDQTFDLEIEEFEGNCLGCFKKSFKKHFMQIDKDPSCYNFYQNMENKYKTVNIAIGERIFFRNNTSTEGLFKMYNDFKASEQHIPKQYDLYENGGCSESCEVYEVTDKV